MCARSDVMQQGSPLVATPSYAARRMRAGGKAKISVIASVLQAASPTLFVVLRPT